MHPCLGGRLTSRFISAMIMISSRAKCVAALVQAFPIEEGSAERQEPITVRKRVAIGGRLYMYWHCTVAGNAQTRSRACPEGIPHKRSDRQCSVTQEARGPLFCNHSERVEE